MTAKSPQCGQTISCVYIVSQLSVIRLVISSMISPMLLTISGLRLVESRRSHNDIASRVIYRMNSSGLMNV
jgi:hypothetical protein